ncbi:MAG: hypothetical protein ABIJ50_06020 [Pseudomonadota bacterium]
MFRSRQEVLEEEWLIVRNSGEIPEIAFHSTYYYLTEDPDGPQLQLDREEIQYLQEAATARYQEIILRDLCYENRELTIYRGVQRAIFNWRRSLAFCERQNTACHNLRKTTKEAFLLLLKKALFTSSNAPVALGATDPSPSISFVFNCSSHDLTLFTQELGITKEQLPENLHLVCNS